MEVAGILHAYRGVIFPPPSSHLQLKAEMGCTCLVNSQSFMTCNAERPFSPLVSQPGFKLP